MIVNNKHISEIKNFKKLQMIFMKYITKLDKLLLEKYIIKIAPKSEG